MRFVEVINQDIIFKRVIFMIFKATQWCKQGRFFPYRRVYPFLNYMYGFLQWLFEGKLYEFKGRTIRPGNFAMKEQYFRIEAPIAQLMRFWR